MRLGSQRAGWMHPVQGAKQDFEDGSCLSPGQMWCPPPHPDPAVRGLSSDWGGGQHLHWTNAHPGTQYMKRSSWHRHILGLDLPREKEIQGDWKWWGSMEREAEPNRPWRKGVEGGWQDWEDKERCAALRKETTQAKATGEDESRATEQGSLVREGGGGAWEPELRDGGCRLTGTFVDAYDHQGP